MSSSTQALKIRQRLTFFRHFSNLLSKMASWGNWIGNIGDQVNKQLQQVKGQVEAAVFPAEPVKDPDGAEETPKIEEANKGDVTDEPAVEEHDVTNTVKEFGTTLFDFAKEATKHVAKTAKTLKDTVEQNVKQIVPNVNKERARPTILGEFEREQQKFIEEQNSEDAQPISTPPWVGYADEAAMKKQILSLSLDSRNFLRDPPAGSQFKFGFAECFPVALATLEEDPNLRKMRFAHVPKDIPEERFWRNYFYRVSLIRQSMQLTNKVKGNEAADEQPQASSSLQQAKAQTVPSGSRNEEFEESSPPESPLQGDFASDGIEEVLNEKELEKDREALGISSQKKSKGGTSSPTGEEEWQKEIVAELNDYELVSDKTGKTEEEWENEITDMLEHELDNIE